jgi:DNA-binding CsgD family transcriptional regulator
MAGLRPRELLGREHELATLEQLLETVRSGGSGSLFLHGEPGIGKSALLERLIASASGFLTVRAVGVQGEVDLPYAGLHQLCRSLLNGIDTLPPPQRHALEVAFGLTSGDASDRYLVGLAVLSLLSEAATTRPLLCVVDDAQWLDTETTRVLAFVARRLGADTVGLVLASREQIGDFAGLRALHVGGLAVAEARRLLDSVVVGRLGKPLRERFLAETHGNPLALLELPHTLTPAEAATGIPRGLDGSVSNRIEESFRLRLASLPDETRRLLVLAAIEPFGDPVLLHRAASRLRISLEAVDAAEEAGLLEIRERWTFRHPLLRSAAYRSATHQERRLAHGALAEALEPADEPDRKAWHRANAAVGPDEGVALELERSAGRAQARGGFAAAATLLQRSVTLTGASPRRAERALRAAEASLQATLFDDARRALATAEAGSLDEFQRARAELLRGHIALFSAPGGEAPALLLKAAKSLESLDVHLARETYLDAWGAAMIRGRPALRGSSVLDVSHAARSCPRPEGPPRPVDLLLDALALLATEGRNAASHLLQEATTSIVDDQSPTTAPRWGWMKYIPTYVLWDEASTHEIGVQRLRTLREAGALAQLPIDLQSLANLAARRGEFARADAAIAEAESVKNATGHSFAPTGAMALAALRGRPDEARPLLDSARENARALGQGVVHQVASWNTAILCNGLGRYEQAVSAALLAVGGDPEELFVDAFASPELVEAAHRTGDLELARSALERVRAGTEFCVTDSARGIAARCRALLATCDTAEKEYRAASDHLSRSRLRPDLARAYLLYGEWLRREGRRIDARDQLRTAHDMLAEIGMEAFAERAGHELTATGGTVRKRRDETRADLTAQELQIAHLASEGLTNPQIGGQLFLSPRTIEWHLRHIYQKLGIRSRRELQMGTLSA